MHRRLFDLRFVASIAAVTAACAKEPVAPGADGPPGLRLDGAGAALIAPVINIPSGNVDSLYAVVSDPGLAGRDVRLAPGVYLLDTLRPNGGRLQLQRDMTLRGEGGRQADVIIDASAMRQPHFLDGTLLTGAIRVGRGATTVASLTIRGAAAGSAGITTDLSDADTARIDIHHVIATGNARGIDVRNVGSGMTDRAMIVALDENVLSGNGQGVRVVNANGARRARIEVTTYDNRITDNTIGMLLANLSTDSASISLFAKYDRLERNRGGWVVLGGNASGANLANWNRIAVTSQGVRFTGNGVTSLGAPPADSVAVAVYGAVSQQAGRASHNMVSVELRGAQFEGNLPSASSFMDVLVYGAQSTSGSPAGTNNSATVTLRGSSKSARWQPPVQSFPSEAAGTNVAVILTP